MPTNHTAQQEVALITKALKDQGLSSYFPTLKGSQGAVQLQHVNWLKQQATQSPEALGEALLSLGVSSEVDREKLVTLLRHKLAQEGRLLQKEVPESQQEKAAEAWQARFVDQEGRLPDELAAMSQLEEEPSAQEGEAVSEEAWPEGMKLVNPHLAHSIKEQGMLVGSTGHGYIHLAAEVERPRPFLGNSTAKKELLASLKGAAKELLAAEEDVQRADVFDAFIIPPGSREGRKVIQEGNYDIHIAEFDIAVLVECRDVEAAKRVRSSAAFEALKVKLDEATHFVHCIVGQNPKGIGPVDHDTDGVFLFNYFFAADVPEKGSDAYEILGAVWEYTAGWWTAKANLTNSTPILPLPDQHSSYGWINHCKWDKGIDIFPHLIFRPSLGRFVLANFTANDIMAMPILYHLA